MDTCKILKTSTKTYGHEEEYNNVFDVSILGGRLRSFRIAIL